MSYARMCMGSSFSFAAMELNSDGNIDRKEYDMVSDIPDTDNDGLISKTDSNCATHAAFNLLDQDRDGRSPGL